MVATSSFMIQMMVSAFGNRQQVQSAQKVFKKVPIMTCMDLVQLKLLKPVKESHLLVNLSSVAQKMNHLVILILSMSVLKVAELRVGAILFCTTVTMVNVKTSEHLLPIAQKVFSQALIITSTRFSVTVLVTQPFLLVQIKAVLQMTFPLVITLKVSLDALTNADRLLDVDLSVMMIMMANVCRS
jgi:hypothetical protein